MIRKFEASDMTDVLNIWLTASIKAHGFVARDFWESKMDAMRNIYIPASETYVFSDNGTIKGFFSLSGDTLAAIFVSPDFQGKGIGRQLMDKSKSLRSELNLSVYQENPKSILFYTKCGFKIIQERVDEYTGHIEILMECSSQ